MEIELAQLIRTLRRLWYIPIVLGLLLAALGFGAASIPSPDYTSTTQILVTTQLTGSPVLAEESRSQTYVNLATSGPVLDRVILELELDITREALALMVTADVVAGTQIIEISVTSDDPQLSADIANAVARNFVTTATDLSVGEVQRHLDGLVQQANAQRDQLVVIETRLSLIDIEENEGNSEIQAEIAQLERERLRVSQILADLNSTIRDLTTSLTTMSIPVVVTDFARPAITGQTISPAMLGLLGGFVGVLIGVAWITVRGFTDRNLRSVAQVVSQPVFTRIKAASLGDGESRELQMLASRVAGVKSVSEGRRLAIVSAREVPTLGNLSTSLDAHVLESFSSVVEANGALDNPDALRAISQADAALVVATVNTSRLDDLEELHRVLESMSIDVLGTVVITR